MKIKHKKDGFIGEFLYVTPQALINEMGQSNLFENMKITDIGYFPKADYHLRERPFGSESYIFIYCYDGEGFVSINNAPEQKVNKGDVIFIPSKTPHRYGTDRNNPWSIYWAHINGNFPQKFKEDIVLDKYIVPSNFLANEKTKNLFQDIFKYLKSMPNLEGHFLCCQIFSHILGLASLSFSSTSIVQGFSQSSVNAVEKSIEYMNENIYSSINLKAIADFVMLSPSYFSGIFKQTTGISPIRFFLNMKIQKASEELFFTTRQVKDIAVSFGFGDTSYFSRLFKKQIGVSPQNYKSQTKG